MGHVPDTATSPYLRRRVVESYARDTGVRLVSERLVDPDDHHDPLDDVIDGARVTAEAARTARLVRGIGERRNVTLFAELVQDFAELMTVAPPDEVQHADEEFTLALGNLLSLVVHGRLVLEQARLRALDDDLLDVIFGLLVKDFALAAVELHATAVCSRVQQLWALSAVERPRTDPEQFERVWQQVRRLCGADEMRTVERNRP